MTHTLSYVTNINVLRLWYGIKKNTITERANVLNAKFEHLTKFENICVFACQKCMYTLYHYLILVWISIHTALNYRNSSWNSDNGTEKYKCVIPRKTGLTNVQTFWACLTMFEKTKPFGQLSKTYALKEICTLSKIQYFVIPTICLTSLETFFNVVIWILFYLNISNIRKFPRPSGVFNHDEMKRCVLVSIYLCSNRECEELPIYLIKGKRCLHNITVRRE